MTVAAVIAATAAASAQETVPTCGGLNATIVITDAEATSRLIQGTEAGDAMVIDLSPEAFPDDPGTITVMGLGGNDAICTSGVDFILGGPGDDLLDAIGVGHQSFGIDIAGEGGNDLIFGTEDGRLDRLSGGDGDDIIHGRGGWDVIAGDAGDDTIYGNAGDDSIFGMGGADTIYGGWGNDYIHGDDDPQQFEYLSTTPDLADTIYGGPGDDYIAGRLGADQLYGGPDNDMLVSNLAQEITELDATTPPELLDTAGARMFGGPGDDVILGSNRWDRIQGGPGNDTLWGFEGRDYMRGGPGNDSIIGGAGIDNVNGNTGNDHLIYDFGDVLNGGWGIDRCEAAVWPAEPDASSCERRGEPTFEYTLSERYERLSSLDRPEI